jgi:uroporphyrinogen III methyltransferase/synthase
MIHAPTVCIEARVPDREEISAIRERADHLLVALTSPSSAENFVAAFGPKRPQGFPWAVAVVGERTGLRARELGLEVILTSPRATAADFGPVLLESTEFPVLLLPGSNLHREHLASTLRAGGREVIEVVVQETRPFNGLPKGVQGHLDEIGLAVAYSPSALGFVESLEARPRELVSRIPFAVMGPTTGDRARELGLKVEIEPENPHEDRLIELVLSWAAARN